MPRFRVINQVEHRITCETMEMAKIQAYQALMGMSRVYDVNHVRTTVIEVLDELPVWL
jgi:hypothetical protein